MKKQNVSKSVQDSGLVTSKHSDALSVTLYQSGLAVVNDVRAIVLAQGASQLLLEGLPERYQDNSLAITGFKGEGELKTGAASFRAANLTRENILDASVGTRVLIREVNQNGRTSMLTGRLKAVLGSEVVVERDNGAVLIVPVHAVELSEGMPEGLSDTPSLLLNTTTTEGGLFELHLLYETGGAGWRARYNAFLDEKRGVLTRMECQVQLTNATGFDIQNAVVKLVAAANQPAGGGAVRSARAYGLEAAPMALAAKSADAFQATNETVGEQQMYLLPGKVTVKSGENQQVCLLLAAEVPVTREFFLPAGNGYWNYQTGADAEKLPVYVRLRLVNDAASKLGTPLPAGGVSIFQADASGAYQKTGNASLNAVAADEKFKVEYGPSSQLKAERRLIDMIEVEEQPAASTEVSEDAEGEGQAAAAAETPYPNWSKPAKQGGPAGRGVQRPRAAAVESDEDAEPVRWREEEREVVLHNFGSENADVQVHEDVPALAEWIKKPEGCQFKLEGPGAAVILVTVPAKGKVSFTYRLRFKLN